MEDNHDEPDHHLKEKDDYKNITQKLVEPCSLFRFVTRLNGRFSLSKMSSHQDIRSKVIAICSNQSEAVRLDDTVMDSDNENDHHDDNNDVEIPKKEEQHFHIDLNDIRQKALEYDRQQLKGIRLANAGGGNLRIVNNYAVTSATCNLL